MSKTKLKNLTIEDLKRHPVWTWTTDVFQNEDLLVPVAITQEELADPDTLLIHSTFLTASGVQREGVVVYDPDLDEVFAIEIIFENARVTLNKNVPDLSNNELDRYAKLTGENISGILPLRFHIVPSKIAISPAEFNIRGK